VILEGIRGRGLQTRDPGPYFMGGPGGSLERNSTLNLWAAKPLLAVRPAGGSPTAGHRIDEYGRP
jgi:hypothetical protein